MHGRARSLSLVIAACLVLGPAPASLAQPLPFTDEALARGVHFQTPLHGPSGRGLILVDLDADGDPDLMAAGGVNNAVGLWENDGTGHFISRSSGSGIAAFSVPSGLVAGDYDADGDLDVYLSRSGQVNALLRNNGNFTFTNVASAARVTNLQGFTNGCAWGDYNADGWPDLYVSNFFYNDASRPNALYRNNADGTFTDVAASFGAAALGLTWQAVFFDFDRDLRPDLYVSNDDGYSGGACAQRNYLFRNDGAGLVDVTFAAGAQACVNSMGIGVGDVNADRWPDIYITNTEEGNLLFLNRGDGTFTEMGEAYGVRSNIKGWGAAFFDFDNSGDLELYVCNTHTANRMYVPGADGVFTDQAPALGVALNGLPSYSAGVADIDNDGDLDMAVQVDLDRLYLFINHEGERRSWAKFRVVGAHPNRFAIGASVDVRVGDRWQMREVMGAGSFKSHDDLTLHFGLNDAARLDEIVARWPRGAAGNEKGVPRTDERILRNYPANHTWTLYPDCMLGGADPVTGAMTSDDFFAFLTCFFTSAGSVTPGCEIMDMDGDAQLTSSDFFQFLDRFFR